MAFTHICTTSDGMRVGCMCMRGQDHPEELFDIPVGEEPKPEEDD